MPSLDGTGRDRTGRDRTGRGVPRAGLNAERIVAEAAVVADELGFDEVTAVEVARRFGVRTASLYSHVASSQAIRAGVSRLALDELADRVQASVGDAVGRAGVRAVVDAYRAYAAEHPGRFAATLLADSSDPDTVRAGVRHADLSRAVIRGYPVPERALDDAVRFLGATLRGFSDLERAGAFARSAPQADPIWETAVAAVDAALAHWPTDR